MGDVIRHIISMCPEDDQDKYRELYELAEERLITTLARGMARAFDLPQWAEVSTVSDNDKQRIMDMIRGDSQ
jgi:hypothetical protein